MGLLEIYLSFSSEKILKIRKKLTKLSPWVWCTSFLGHSVFYFCTVHCRYFSA